MKPTANSLIRLLRPTHWLKNVLVLVPLAFSGRMFITGELPRAILATCAFSLAASLVYVANDLADVERDRSHPTKCRRPIASGAVTPNQAKVLGLSLALGVVASTAYLGFPALAILVLYIALNLAYSMHLKQIPLLDVTILATGYLLRVLFGAVACGVEVSDWLYLTVLTGSFYLGFGKRRGELDSAGSRSRAALLGYTRAFLDKNMYVTLGLALGFYALWSREGGARLWTVPLAIVTLMRYSLDVEQGGDGDPMQVISSDSWLLLLGTLWAVSAVATAYLS